MDLYTSLSLPDDPTIVGLGTRLVVGSIDERIRIVLSHDRLGIMEYIHGMSPEQYRGFHNRFQSSFQDIINTWVAFGYCAEDDTYAFLGLLNNTFQAIWQHGDRGLESYGDMLDILCQAFRRFVWMGQDPVRAKEVIGQIMRVSEEIENTSIENRMSAIFRLIPHGQ